MYTSQTKQLRDYQKDAVKAFFQYCNNGYKNGHPILWCPTGSGKSLIIAEIIKKITEKKPSYRIICLAHSKEIVDQDIKELQQHNPLSKISIYSAGLGKKCLKHNVIFASIQSIHSKPEHVGFVDLVIIDEAHLCPIKNEGEYRKFIYELSLVNPNLKVLGLTATPWRINNVSLISKLDEAIFGSIVYEITIKRLIESGHLVNVVTPKPNEKTVNADFSQLKLSSTGDFTTKSTEDAISKIIEPSLKEAVYLAKDRKAWVVFCPTIGVCERVVNILNGMGIASKSITSETISKERDDSISDFKKGKFKALVSVVALTTGFNAPIADCLICLRPTQSSSLWIQMIGRVMRINPGKNDALLLDYGGNIDRHGPIDQIKPILKTKSKVKKNGKTYTSITIKICQKCQEEISNGCVSCPYCCHEFHTVVERLEETASSADVFSYNKPEGELVNVNYVLKQRGKKEGMPDHVRMIYICSNGKSYTEFLCPEHKSLDSQRRLMDFFSIIDKPIPTTVNEIMEIEIPKPKQIKVESFGKYPKILGFFY